MEFNLSKIKEAEKSRKAQAELEEVTEEKKPPDNGQALVPANLSLELVKPRFDEYLERVTLFEKSAQALEVKDDETRGQAANLAAGAKKLSKAIDERRKEIAEPYNAFTKGLKAFADRFIDRLTSAAGIAGKKELQYIERQELARREAEKKALEATAKIQADINAEAKAKGIEPIKLETPIVPETKTTARTEAGVTSYTIKRWVCEITDPLAVPREYCSPDQKKLNAAVENGVRKIAGCNIEEKTGIGHRG